MQITATPVVKAQPTAKVFTRKTDNKVYVLLENSDQVVVFDPMSALPRLSTRWSKEQVISDDRFVPMHEGKLTIDLP